MTHTNQNLIKGHATVAALAGKHEQQPSGLRPGSARREDLALTFRKARGFAAL
jgi:hypothetical protein